MYTLDYIKSKKARVDILNLLREKGIRNSLLKLNNFDISKTLCRYSSIDKYTVKNLKENSLTATIPTEFNDLYDSTMHSDTHSQHDKIITELNLSSKKLGHEEIVNQDLRKKMLKNATKLDEHKLSFLTKDFRIVCLSTDFKDIKMWSHYGNNNKGICTMYDFSKSINEINNFIYPVIYIDEPIDVTELCEDENKIQHAVISSIISKSIEWEYEKEWRIVFYFGESKEKRLQLINIPRPEYIFLGNRFIDNYREVKMDKSKIEELKYINEFLDYVKLEKVHLKIIQPKIRSFQLEYKDISVDTIIRDNY